jgi:hypothetical protein
LVRDFSLDPNLFILLAILLATVFLLEAALPKIEVNSVSLTALFM